MMNAALDRCFSFLHTQAKTKAEGRSINPTRRAVTISRQAGCGALLVAEKLAAGLSAENPKHPEPWTVLDRDLMHKVLEDHRLPAYLAKYLPEDRVPAIEDTVVDIFGMRPPVAKLVAQTAETILKFAELGNVIIVGRAGNLVTAKNPHVLHVRLVAPLEDRIARISLADHKTPAEARKFCLEEEAARARYLKTYFNCDINDPLLYHLVINTSRVGCDPAARLIAEAVQRLP